MKHRCLSWVTAVMIAVFCVRIAGAQVVAVGRTSTSADAVLARVVTIELKNVSLREAVSAVSAAAHVQIQYRSELLNGMTAPVSLRATRMPLGEAFDRLFAGMNLRAVAVGNDVVGIQPLGKNPAADGGIVVGQITDKATKRPVADATVIVTGTKLIVRTGPDGMYRIAGVPVGRREIMVRRLGYAVSKQPVSIENNATATANVSLSATATQLEQVVTTVTGPQRRVELGNAIGTIQADSLMKEAPITSLSQLLTARVPGLTVSQGQGTVGGNVRLQIRGLTSILMGSSPIVVVDGVRYNSTASDAGKSFGERVSPLNDLNPNDIESVDVLKGPSAATLYGTDASNGVIVITTKRGKAGPPRWTAFATGMRNSIPRNEGRELFYGWASSFDGNPGPVIYCALEYVAQGLCSQDSVTHGPPATAASQVTVLQPNSSYGYGLGVSGGPQALRYLFSGTYENQGGGIGLSPAAIKVAEAQTGASLPEEYRHPNAQSLLNLRSNVSANVGSKTEFNVSLGYTHGNTRFLDFASSPFAQGEQSGTVDSVQQGYLITTQLNQFSWRNTEENNRLVGSATGRSNLMPWLNARALIGMDLGMRATKNLLPRNESRSMNPNGEVFEGTSRQLAVSGDLGVTATFGLGRFSTRTSAGTQYVRSVDDGLGASGFDLPPGATTVDRARDVYIGRFYSEAVTLGSYLEEVVGLNDRLFLTAAVRADGASTFGKGYSAVGYPKISASWLLSDEPFFPHSRFLDELRLRTAYGVAGRQPPAGLAGPTYSALNLSQIDAGTPIQLDGLGNPLLRPERGTEWESGIDAGLLQRRLQVELTWYNRRTTDMLLPGQVPFGLWSRFVNAGLVTEHGMEAQVTATVLDTRPVHWVVTLQQSTRTNKLVHMGSLSPNRNVDGGYVEGYPLGARFMTPIVGYGDANGDGYLSAEEVQLGDSAVYVGVNLPPKSQTLNTTIGLLQQRLRFSALFDRQSGFTIFNQFLTDCFYCRSNVDPTSSLLEQAYHAVRVVQKPGLPATRLIESGNFTRLREVSAALTMPATVTRALHVSSSNVSLSVRNVALWKKYSGSDPESTPVLNTTLQQTPIGIPQSRTWVFRCDLGL